MTRPTPRARRARWLPTTLRGRVFLTAGLTLAIPLLAAALLVGSVWSESHYPSDSADASAIARARGSVTKPIVRAVGRHLRRRVRTSFQRRIALTGLSLDETIARLRDETLDPAERGIYAHRLARCGSPDAVRALLEVFATAQPEHRAFLAQLLGSTGDPSVAPWLRPLLDDPDDALAIAAIRGLSALEGDAFTGALARMVADGDRSAAVRIEAAVGLGHIRTEPARRALLATLARNPGGDLGTQVLDSLGRFRFEDVSATFAEVVAAPDSPTDTRVAAVEALSNSTREAVPFLLAIAEGDRSADVRASAAWAISAHEGDGDLGRTLASMAEREPDVDVRRRLYEAVMRQHDIPAERLLPTVRAEHDVAARVAGFNALGRAVGRDRAKSVAGEFDDDIVPELTRIATNPNSLNIRMRAVFALRRARTQAAQDALAIVAGTETPQVAAAARHGLQAPE